NIDTGAWPASHLRSLAPQGAYRAVEVNGTLQPDPANSLRHEALVQVFTAVDPNAAAAVVRRIRPLLQEAYADLGYPDGDFEEALEGAVSRLLATPIPERPPALEKMVTSYRYVDPELEALDPAQKAFLRMGSENMRKVRSQLIAIARALDLDIDT
ncbi:MAG: DUF3014 domain-containing protein, partial [Thermoanaerobaculia bacterium]|nr:DUF3014 domain-containing protein [Thermoanaerobaculia bacterium]